MSTISTCYEERRRDRPREAPRRAAPALLFSLALLAASACAARPVVDRAGHVERLAVVVRVEGAPVIRLDDALSPRSEDGRPLLAEMVQRVVSPYALEESLRHAWISALDGTPSWQVVSSLEVSSALGALLAREERPSYERLASMGVDAVLEVNVTEWGIASHRGFIGGFLRMDSRVVRLKGREKTVWRSRDRVDLSREGRLPVERASLLLEDETELESVLVEMITAAGASLARSMRVGG